MEKKRNNKMEILSFASDVGFGVCLGIVVDQFAGTSFVFTGIGTILGIGLAIILKKSREKKGA